MFFFFFPWLPLNLLGDSWYCLDPTPSYPTSLQERSAPTLSPIPKCEQAPYKSERISFCYRASSSSLGLPITPPLSSPTPLNLPCLVDPATDGAGSGSRLFPPCTPQAELSPHARLGAPDPQQGVRMSLQSALVLQSQSIGPSG